MSALLVIRNTFDRRGFMSMFDPEIPFDPEKPFYPLVLSYLTQLHGLLEVVGRGICGQFDALVADSAASPLTREQLVDMVCSGVIDGYQDHIRAVLESADAPLPGIQRIGSVIDVSPRVEMGAVAAEMIGSFEEPINVFNDLSAGALLIMSWEVTAESHTRDPLWEFHRHCRNAAAHKGHFSLRGAEPRRDASWRGLRIVPDLNHAKLFRHGNNDGLIGPADVLYLLSDVEKAFL